MSSIDKYGIGFIIGVCSMLTLFVFTPPPNEFTALELVLVCLAGAISIYALHQNDKRLSDKYENKQ